MSSKSFYGLDNVPVVLIVHLCNTLLKGWKGFDMIGHATAFPKEFDEVPDGVNEETIALSDALLYVGTYGINLL